MVPHNFHIPVMGTGFTIDTPIHVAPWGVTSALSLVDDELIEQMRAVHAANEQEPYLRISRRTPDARALRIKEYLDLIGRVVAKRTSEIRSAPLVQGSPLWQYFELLPEGALKRAYRAAVDMPEGDPKDVAVAALRELVLPGDIEANIMVKLDREPRRQDAPAPGSDALAAMRGFCNSEINGALVLSAGMNSRLYAYAGEVGAFYPDEDGHLKKRLVLKVSDYRSAEVQSRLLAKRGLWVSEFRVESGLNCGGHAFVGSGQLLGQVMADFAASRERLKEHLLMTCNAALTKQKRPLLPDDVAQGLTVQGGVGTYAEHRFLLDYYGADRVGWGTPFLVVPEVTQVDPDTLNRLLAAGPSDIQLSDASPLGIPFWLLTTSSSEKARRARIAEEAPGSPCLKGHLMLDSSLTGRPLCPASAVYQRRKLDGLQAEGAPEGAIETVLGKACICHDLGGGAALKYGFGQKATPAVCPGPNIAYFRHMATFPEMVDHIYGRQDLLEGVERPHVFVKELSLCIDQLDHHARLEPGQPKRVQNEAKFRAKLIEGIRYYKELARDALGPEAGRFLAQLARQEERLGLRPAEQSASAVQ